MQTDELTTVQIDKLVHGGQGLGTLPDGRKVFVWNALPGEAVTAQIIKTKKSYAEGVAQEVVKASPDRIEPKEVNYLATSPWQILNFDSENYWKVEIIRELFQHAGMKLPKFGIQTNGQEFHYRNKMEYSFWGDDSGLHLALYNRGSHQKQSVEGSALAIPAIDKAANALLAELRARKIRAGDLKTITVRYSQEGKTVASLFVKPQSFPKLALPNKLAGLRVYHSNPKSPASIRTELLYEVGNASLSDTLQGHNFQYDVDSFFQVNIPVFELVLARLQQLVTADSLIDMYAGVGSLGLCLAKKAVDLIELDPATAAMAIVNAEASGLKASVTQTSVEKALDYILPDKPIIFDPPRAGLHKDVTDRLLEVLPSQVIYLSCNPATQARDLALLQPKYKISHFEAFNFFPRTPHIETLAIIEKR